MGKAVLSSHDAAMTFSTLKVQHSENRLTRFFGQVGPAVSLTVGFMRKIICNVRMIMIKMLRQIITGT